MRRRNLWCMVVLLITLLLGGCGGGSSAAETTAAPATTATTVPVATTMETTTEEASTPSSTEVEVELANDNIVGSNIEINEEIRSSNSHSIDNDYEFIIFNQVRLADGTDKEWKPSVDAKVGDIVEFRIEYINTSSYTHNNVGIRDVLPKNLEYIPGTTKLKNVTYPDWLYNTDDTIATEGINIGHYAPNSNGIVYFQAKVVDNCLADGSNTLVNWGQGYVTIDGKKIMLQDYVRVNVDNEN